MKQIAGFLIAVLTFGLVWLMDHPINNGALPPLGRLIDPVNGCLANAEPTDKDFNAALNIPKLHQEVQVWIDDRMVPHIRAENDYDLYFVEGYIHASQRLWQMDMETRAAAGRVSEVIGEKGLAYDRLQRRKGMVFAAENSLKEMEREPRTKTMLGAYTDGINQYIATLKYRDYPLEYKIMGFCPEQWTNIKSALLMKYMADDLTGGTNDIPLTYLREVLSPEIFQLLYPATIKGSTTVIPAGTVFEKPSLARPPAPVDTVFPHFSKKDFKTANEDGIGSNNWAVSGSRTQSGAPILCDDPHLGLHMPSLWFEAQLQTPEMNVYGVSLPGAPGVIIGFNDSISWGFTNNYRDVKDYFLIKRVAGTADKYWLDGEQKTFTQRMELIKVKNGKDCIDTVSYSVHGPVLYDEHYAAEGGLDKPLAMCWMGHKATNELLAVYLMNRAKDYNSFVDGIINFQCPGQSMIYADRAGNIALWGQGQFINKWKDQGRFILDGSKKSAMWGELIPPRENPHALNPAQGYLSSANQCVTDSTYPYLYNGDYIEFRGWRVNQLLAANPKATIQDMFAMQNDTYSILAAHTLPIMLKYLPTNLAGQEKIYADKLRTWDYKLSAEGVEASIYQVWWYYFYSKVWSGFSNVPSLYYPLPERTMQLLQAADSSKLNIKQFDNLSGLMQASFRQMADSLKKAEKGGLQWYNVKNTSVTHLTKLPAFSYDHFKIGGWGNTLNAAKKDHGPSWRMVVQMGKNEIEAYGVYPGGQSGNPGSKYYATFLNDWAAGKYYKLLFLPNSTEQNNKAITYKMLITNSK